MDDSTRLISRIVAGGQTGADRGALDAAIASRVVHGGWCPAGGWAEDKPFPPGVLVDYPGLKPTIEADPTVRTRLNVRDSHATVVVGASETSAGAALMIEWARAMGRPCLVGESDPSAARDWLAAVGRELIVNIGGPRESEQPGTYERCRDFVTTLLGLDG